MWCSVATETTTSKLSAGKGKESAEPAIGLVMNPSQNRPAQIIGNAVGFPVVERGFDATAYGR